MVVLNGQQQTQHATLIADAGLALPLVPPQQVLFPYPRTHHRTSTIPLGAGGPSHTTRRDRSCGSTLGWKHGKMR